MKGKDLKNLRQIIAQHLRPFSMDVHHTPLTKQKDRRLAGRFIDRIHSGSFDPGDLPYYSEDGTAKCANKAECVLAMMSFIVQLYWKIASENRDAIQEELNKILDVQLILLDRVYNNFDQLKLLGDAKGYCLLKSYRKDLYGKKEEKQVPEEDGTEEVDKGADDTVDGPKAQVEYELPDGGHMSLVG